MSTIVGAGAPGGAEEGGAADRAYATTFLITLLLVALGLVFDSLCRMEPPLVLRSGGGEIDGVRNDQGRVSRYAGMGGRLAENSNAFNYLQVKYLVVWSLAVFGDWLQGPYFYRIHERYGYSRLGIQALFIVGSLSAAFLGIPAAYFADVYGRRNLTFAYFAIYGLSCITMHFNVLWVLVIGRILSGISQSLLFSVFDSWLVQKHQSEGFPPVWLKDSFKKAAMIQGLMAILAGVFSQLAVAYTVPLDFGPLSFGQEVAVYQVALAVFVGGLLCTACLWDVDQPLDLVHTGLRAQLEDIDRVLGSKLLCVGIIQSLFEASMLTFTCLWTPAMESTGERLPLGIIFATLMASLMMGSVFFSILSNFILTIPQTLMVALVTGLASLSCGMWVTSPLLLLMSFACFELSVGIYFPSISTLRATIVPEQLRTSIYGLFRLPLNVVTVAVLVQDIPLWQMFAVCTALLLGSVLALGVLMYIISLEEGKPGLLFHDDPSNTNSRNGSHPGTRLLRHTHSFSDLVTVGSRGKSFAPATTVATFSSNEDKADTTTFGSYALAHDSDPVL